MAGAKSVNLCLPQSMEITVGIYITYMIVRSHNEGNLRLIARL
jgi:hypothetical protein